MEAILIILMDLLLMYVAIYGIFDTEEKRRTRYKSIRVDEDTFDDFEKLRDRVKEEDPYATNSDILGDAVTKMERELYGRRLNAKRK